MDRLIDWFASVVREMVKDLPFAGSYAYEVTGQNFSNQTLDLKPLGHKMPALDKVPMRVPGMRMELASGSEVVVCFANNDPSKPYVAMYPQDPTAVTKMELVGDTAANARDGDSVGITPAQFANAVPVANLSTGAVTLSNTMQGTITSGSSKVFS